MLSTIRIASAVIARTKECWFQEKKMSCKTPINPVSTESVKHTSHEFLELSFSKVNDSKTSKKGD